MAAARAVPAAGKPGGRGGARPVYRNPDVAEARRRRERRQVRPYRPLSNQQIGTKVAAGRRRREKDAAAATQPQPAQAQQAAQAAPQAAQAAPARGGRDFTTEGSGALLALFAYPLLVNGLRGGPARARGWLAAKFINRPYGAGPTAPGGRSGTGGGHPPGGPHRTPRTSKGGRR